MTGSSSETNRLEGELVRVLDVARHAPANVLELGLRTQRPIQVLPGLSAYLGKLLVATAGRCFVLLRRRLRFVGPDRSGDGIAGRILVLAVRCIVQFRIVRFRGRLSDCLIGTRGLDLVGKHPFARRIGRFRVPLALLIRHQSPPFVPSADVAATCRGQRCPRNHRGRPRTAPPARHGASRNIGSQWC